MVRCRGITHGRDDLITTAEELTHEFQSNPSGGTDNHPESWRHIEQISNKTED